MLEIEKLRVEYGSGDSLYVAVKDQSFSVAAGEFFTLLGPSGCGKTTTLRSIAGLETPTSGRIAINSKDVFNSATRTLMPVHARDTSMVFQSYAIWPHMSVAQNVAFPLEAAGRPRAEIGKKVTESLELVGLGGFAERPATMLSGGQQQRVALARALIKNAALLLLDEPLSNLDAKLRDLMRAELRDLQERLGQTTIYVTHDQEEALSMSDRIAFMEGGVILELGTPQQLYLCPHRVETARFLGNALFLEARDVQMNGEEALAQTALGPLRIRGAGARKGSILMIRPEHIGMFEEGTTIPDENCVNGTIRRATFSGKSVEYDVEVGDMVVPVHRPSARIRPEGTAVTLHLSAETCVLLEGSL
ncbi:MAG: ABC transporter ATP-binding protein [Zhengella sp.]|uniref:ABC transporter ATP-binding protein n=1 Tax=Zhengella sp. TaxID=2282762 RepID=UPI0035299021